MTDHKKLQMHFEERRISDPEIIDSILRRGHTGTLTMFDDPYPYVIPIHYGYEFEKGRFILYIHTAKTGHKLALIKKNDHVAFNYFEYLNRAGHRKYRNELQDYRSVTIFGRAEFVTDENELLLALNSLQRGGSRPALKALPSGITDSLIIFRICAEQITAKSNYPISTLEESAIPPLDY